MEYTGLRLTINRSKRDALKQRALELGVIPSVVIVYAVFRLLDMLNGKCISATDRNFVGLAMSEYKPYEPEIDICNTCVSWVISNEYVSRKELSKRLSEKGFRIVSLFKAFYNALLKCDANSIPRYSTVSGFILSSVTPESVRRLKNTPFECSARLSESIFQRLSEIAKLNKVSVYRMLSCTIDTLIAMEFEKESFIENVDVFRCNILTYNKKVTGVTGDGVIYTYKTKNLERGVRILYLLEKYGIPGKNELIYRIIRFIFLLHSGKISLNPIQINDGFDYIETRMVRNDFRKEVLYAAAR